MSHTHQRSLSAAILRPIRVARLTLPLVVISTASLVQGASVAFDDATQLNQFVLNGDANATLTVSPTAGAGGGGGLVSTSQNPSVTSAIFANGFDNSIGSTEFVQIDYRMQFQTQGPDLRLGFTTTANGLFNGTDDLWVETYGGGSPKILGFDVNASFSNLSPVSMIQGDWFSLRLAIVKQTATGYSATVTLSDLGSSGLSPAVVISTQDFGFSSASLGSASELYSGFFLFQQTPAADNFVNSSPDPTATPLPAAAWSAPTLLTLLAALKLRRRTIPA